MEKEKKLEMLKSSKTLPKEERALTVSLLLSLHDVWVTLSCFLALFGILWSDIIEFDGFEPTCVDISHLISDSRLLFPSFFFFFLFFLGAHFIHFFFSFDYYLLLVKNFVRVT